MPKPVAMPRLRVPPTEVVLEEWRTEANVPHRLAVDLNGDLWVQVAYTWGLGRERNTMWVSCVHPEKHLPLFTAPTPKARRHK